METEILTLAAQSGMAGLIALLWMLERRGAVARERRLGQAHDRIIEQKLQLEQLLRVVTENTRAIASLESAQRALALMLSRHDGNG